MINSRATGAPGSATVKKKKNSNTTYYLAPSRLVHEMYVQPAQPHCQNTKQEERIHNVEKGQIGGGRLPP